MAAKHVPSASSGLKSGEKEQASKQVSQAKSLAEQVNEELTCAICFSRYDKPKVLPCLHSYCQKCLVDMVSSARDKSQIACPQCQEKHTVPPEGVHGFKTYFTINNLLELLHIHESTSGEAGTNSTLTCENGLDKNPAIARCLTCSCYLCSECLSLHKKMRLTTAHKTLTFDEIKHSDQITGVRSVEKKIYCHDHDEEILKLYCTTCKEAICRDCALVKHQSHKYVFVRDIRPEINKELETLMQAVQSKEGEFQSQIEYLEEVRRINSSTLESCEKTVNTSCQSLIDAIEMRRAALLQELHRVHEVEEKSITSESDALSMALVRLSNSLRFTRQLVENGDDLEVVTMSAQATETLGGLKKMVVDKGSFGPVFLKVEFGGNVSADVNQYGNIVHAPQPVPADIIVKKLPNKANVAEDVVFGVELSARVAKSENNSQTFYGVKLTNNDGNDLDVTVQQSGTSNFFRGTSSEQDARFYNKEKKLRNSLKYPPNIGTKVDMGKVNLDIIKPWITLRVTELLGIDDDVVIDFVFNMLETNQYPDPKELQLNLTGFLHGKNARVFMQELWELLTSAQENIGGIPTKFLEQKKEEIRLKKLEQERIAASLQSHTDAERELLERRQREYEEREAERLRELSAQEGASAPKQEGSKVKPIPPSNRTSLLPTPGEPLDMNIPPTDNVVPTGVLQPSNGLPNTVAEEQRSKSKSRSKSRSRSSSRSPKKERGSESPYQRKTESRSPERRRRGSKSPDQKRRDSRSPDHRRRGSRSPDQNRRGSRSPDQKKRSSRSPDHRRRGSRSPDHRRRGSRSPDQKKHGSRSPDHRRRGSRSPDRRRRGSRSPDHRRRGSRSPEHRRRGNRSADHRRRGSRSPDWRRRSSRSPDRRRRSRDRGKHSSRSPDRYRRRRSHSGSPRRRRSRSRSPARHRYRSPPRGRRRPSHSPDSGKRGKRSRSRSLTPERRRRSHSRSPVQRRTRPMYSDRFPEVRKQRRRSPSPIHSPLRVTPPPRRRQFSPRSGNRPLRPHPPAPPTRGRPRSLSRTPPHKRPEYNVSTSGSESEAAMTPGSTSTSSLSLDLSEPQAPPTRGRRGRGRGQQTRRMEVKRREGGRKQVRSPSPPVVQRSPEHSSYDAHSSRSRSSSPEPVLRSKPKTHHQARASPPSKSTRATRRVSASPERRIVKRPRSKQERKRTPSSDRSSSMSDGSRSRSHSTDRFQSSSPVPQRTRQSPVRSKLSRKQSSPSESDSPSPTPPRMTKGRKSEQSGRRGLKRRNESPDISDSESEDVSPSPPPAKKRKKHHKRRSSVEGDSPSPSKGHRHKKKHSKKHKKHSKKKKRVKRDSDSDGDFEVKEQKLRKRALQSLKKAKH